MTKNKHGTLSRNLGIASIILAFISPIASVVCGVVGLKSQKEKGKEDYVLDLFCDDSFVSLVAAINIVIG